MKHRRIDIFGHQTSLCLEPEYWDWLREIAAKCDATLKDIIVAIAVMRRPDRSLHSEIRLAVAKYFHGGDPTIYHCPGHIVPARDGGVHWFPFRAGKAAKAARRGRRLSVRKAA
jgi:predicted DNA-binding ribbon-helix-helix protein